MSVTETRPTAATTGRFERPRSLVGKYNYLQKLLGPYPDLWEETADVLARIETKMYYNHTGDGLRLADGALDVLVPILAERYLAYIDHLLYRVESLGLPLGDPSLIRQARQCYDLHDWETATYWCKKGIAYCLNTLPKRN